MCILCVKSQRIGGYHIIEPTICKLSESFIRPFALDGRPEAADANPKFMIFASMRLTNAIYLLTEAHL